MLIVQHNFCDLACSCDLSKKNMSQLYILKPRLTKNPFYLKSRGGKLS